ncbi:MAG TPA: metal-dependent transcriptional regulator [Candidatus Ozemobacteraceae bacterium]|nr:metal-dependent transcriptional regulator [Candidatus Ozemobacteraceae bacterium]HQG27367.1 metal-dependent transcriptional regulator [Candidatus Ozemobacteraceae bacterium]
MKEPGESQRSKKGLSSTLESYLEHIHELQRKYGAVRATDIASAMGCTTPSVTNALRRLAKLELIKYETYRPVTLTKLGESTIRRLNSRHRVLADFFLNVLELPEELAEEEACSLEHKISPATIARLADYMEFLHQDLGDATLQRRKRDFANFRNRKQSSR